MSDLLQAVAILCSLTGPCDVEHATDVMRSPERFQLPAKCLMFAQEMLAGSEIGRNLTGAERVRFLCPRARVPV